MNMNLENYARRYMEGFTHTTNLTKLEQRLKNREVNTRDEYAVGAYLYYTKKNLNHFKHKYLCKTLDNYKEALKSKDVHNKYYATELSLRSMANKRNSDKNYKERLVNEFYKQFYKSKELSLNYLVVEFNKSCSECELKYSNTYNFFFKKEYSKLNRRTATKLFNFTKELLNE